ncbi:hypothetical protein TNCV_4858231 [Trichonephila clavipes]|nr:hypothetical protein TNCV_4858231 [Trichonephila clavipes]
MSKSFPRHKIWRWCNTAPDSGPIREIILDRAKSSVPGFWRDKERDNKGEAENSDREPLPELQGKKTPPKLHPDRVTIMSTPSAPSFSQAKF